MVIDDLHLFRASLGPAKADPPLLVDPDAMLPSPPAFERLELVAGWNPQVLQPSGDMHHRQLAAHHAEQVAGQLARHLPLEDFLRLFAGETPDHAGVLTRDVNTVKRGKGISKYNRSARPPHGKGIPAPSGA